MTTHPRGFLLVLLAVLSGVFLAPAASAAEKQEAVGVFLGIEEGDYAHWKLRLSNGDEVSYFILRPDASVEKVLAGPKKFIGKKCKVIWKKSTEDIQEAGGKMEIEQILSVEWLDKK